MPKPKPKKRFTTPFLTGVPRTLKTRKGQVIRNYGVKGKQYQVEELRVEDKGRSVRKNTPKTGKRGDGYPKSRLDLSKIKKKSALEASIFKIK